MRGRCHGYGTVIGWSMNNILNVFVCAGGSWIFTSQNCHFFENRTKILFQSQTWQSTAWFMHPTLFNQDNDLMEHFILWFIWIQMLFYARKKLWGNGWSVQEWTVVSQFVRPSLNKIRRSSVKLNGHFKWPICQTERSIDFMVKFECMARNTKVNIPNIADIQGPYTFVDCFQQVLNNRI